MIRLIFLVLSVIILPIFWQQILSEYWANHSYYIGMLNWWTNWQLLIWWLVFACIPLLYLIIKQKQTILWFAFSLLLWIFSFWLTYIWIKDSILWSWWIMWLINCLLLVFLLFYFFLWSLSFWVFIKEKLFKLKDKDIYDYFISFWVWIVSFLLVNYVLVLTNLFFSWISWILFAFLWYMIYFKRESIKNFESELFSIFKKYYSSLNKFNLIKYIGIFLILISIIYFFFWFIYSYIPYPTAWDANHSYFFYPKMRAYNSWFYWGESSMWNAPYLWVVYIAYWFNLFVPFENFLWISPDTIAVEMNFLSWILVLIFGLSLIKKVIDLVSNYFDDWAEDDVKTTIFNLWWFLILIWLTSWMWAFLVFVDNKTDLWVMTLIILAIFSWFEFIKKYMSVLSKPDELPTKEGEKSILQSIVISWFMFAAAIMAKPTAFLDVTNLWMFIVFLWIWVVSIVWMFLIILWLLAYIKFRWINEYFSVKSWFISLILWAGLVFVWFFEDILWRKFKDKTLIVKNSFQRKLKTLYYIFVWWIAILWTLLVFKWPYIGISQYKVNHTFSPQGFFRSLILSKTTQLNNWFWKLVDLFSVSSVYADSISWSVETWTLSTWLNENIPVVSSLDYNNCSISAVGVSDTKALFNNLKKSEGDTYAEDVWRYVWYWWKKFENPWWLFVFWKSNKCITSKLDAKILCENESAIENFDLAKLKSILPTLPVNSDWYKILSWVINSDKLKDVNVSTFKADESVLSALSDPIQKLRDYHKDFAIKIKKVCLVSADNKDVASSDDCDIYTSSWVNSTDIVYQYDVYIPYKYLVPFNITFNWSLQNLSSYYTDIWYIWLIIMIFVVISLFYWLFTLNKFLIGFSWVTLFWWVIWFFIWWWILWYWIGLIMWSILGFIVFVYFLIDKNRPLNKNYLWSTFVIIFTVFASWQLLLNLLRISTQWWSGPFVWYKQSVWQDSVIDEELKNQEVLKFWYNAKDVFTLQFPHYNKFIDIVNNRKPWEWVFLAGTYARYFIKNQNGIIYDQFLVWLWEIFSDNDVCKSYLRLKDKNIKYIAIDPNIWTVVMWWWNMSLFDRFFAKINPVSNKLQEDGVITMLWKLVSKWYVTYISSNNLGAKYAYALSDEYLKSKVWDQNISDDDMAILRWRLAAARYWSNETVSKLLFSIATDRILNWDFISDISDLLGKSVDEYKLKKLAADIIATKDGTTYSKITSWIKDFSQDEKTVFIQYLMVLQAMSWDKKGFEENVMSFIKQSISASSQIITLEVK